MHHHPVKSSRIISVAYDDASATLEIYFYHQPPLQYTGVP
ncbi:KTSC domain-containing protein, partial [Klebsiella sp. MS 92-3]